MHAIATVKTKGGYRKFAFQRGTVENITQESITVLSNDEYAATYILSDTTKYQKNCKKVTVSAIADGDTVNVEAKHVGSHFTAELISEGSLTPKHHGGKGGPGNGPGNPGGPGNGGDGPGSGGGSGDGS